MIGSKFPITLPVATYSSSRHLFQDGDIGLCSGTGSFSKMIQRATGSDWSHVFILQWVKEWGRLMVLESVEGVGVRMVPLSAYLRDYNGAGEPYPGGIAIARHRTMNPEKSRNGAGWAVPKLGYDYDNKEIAKIAYRLMFNISGDVDNDSEYICSEYAQGFCTAAGSSIKTNQLGFISPTEFANDENIDLVTVLRGF